MQEIQQGSYDEILDLVDLKRYPVDKLESDAGQTFLRQCQEQMRTYGWCSLDGFIRPDALETLAAEATALLPDAEQLTITRNIYSAPADLSPSASVPARREYTHHPLQLADDQIPQHTLTKRLYHCDPLMDLVRQIEGKTQLYRSGDEFQALNIVALPPGEWHGWHYDKNECTVTLLLQPAEKGGEFVFIPDCRTAYSEDIETVSQFLDGDMSAAKTFGRSAGTFTLFRGECSLHGVTKVEGEKPRITAIFTYDEQPNRQSTDDVNIRVYGPRVAQILEQRREA